MKHRDRIGADLNSSANLGIVLMRPEEIAGLDEMEQALAMHREALESRNIDLPW
jgi:hypothetical protein